MSFEETSLQHSKGFLKALQELKSLRPQLYSAAEYCENSYLHNEEKHMVLENLKNYAIQALVNTVDHLGTVASKFGDLFEQQLLGISTSEVKIACLKQQLHTCITYMDIEGLKQQQKMAITPRHCKHYNLPASLSRKVQSSPQRQIDYKGKQIETKSKPHLSEVPLPQTLSWHLATEDTSIPTLSASKVPPKFAGLENHKPSETVPRGFHATMDAEEDATVRPVWSHLQSFSMSPTCGAMLFNCGLAAQQKEWRGGAANSKEAMMSSPLRSLSSPKRPVVRGIRPLGRSKTMVSAFLSKHKFTK